jgi:hypothetical protein
MSDGIDRAHFMKMNFSGSCHGSSFGLGKPALPAVFPTRADNPLTRSLRDISNFDGCRMATCTSGGRLDPRTNASADN